MEELAASFSGVLVDPNAENSTAAPHPRFSLYKKTPKRSQEERRKEILQRQKDNRFNNANLARKLALEESSDDDTMEERGEVEVESMDTAPIRRRQRRHQDQLMYSEWLIEVPEELEQDWLLVPCPVGKRSLVISSRGKTRVYSKAGIPVNTFISLLPGGSPATSRPSALGRKGTFSILDCIYDERLATYHVLDIICWNGIPYHESETECRFFILNSRLAEIPELQELTNANRYRFRPLNWYSCGKEEIRQVLAQPVPFPGELDGLLFYHKQTHYTAGYTPLVGWLKPYMVPELLGVEVPEAYLNQRPNEYDGMTNFLKDYYQNAEERRKVLGASTNEVKSRWSALEQNT